MPITRPSYSYNQCYVLKEDLPDEDIESELCCVTEHP